MRKRLEVLERETRALERQLERESAKKLLEAYDGPSVFGPLPTGEQAWTAFADLCDRAGPEGRRKHGVTDESYRRAREVRSSLSPAELADARLVMEIRLKCGLDSFEDRPPDEEVN